MWLVQACHSLILNHRNTVGPWFDALKERGFIRMSRAPGLGPPGVGQTSHWALGELPADVMKSAPKAFTVWRQKNKPPTRNGTGCYKNDALSGIKSVLDRLACLKAVTPRKQLAFYASQKTGHIYI
jgi:hypothetical protein